MPRKYYIICLAFSLWTIIQTGFHLVFVIYGYYISRCETSPTQAATIFFYLTYLYNNDCGAPQLKNVEGLDSRSLEAYISKIIGGLTTDEAEITLEEIVRELLTKLEMFPEHAQQSVRASVFLLCFIILDGAWIVSTVSLLLGTCLRIKETLALVFYGPWLVLTVCVCIFDAAASVLFGLDIAETTNFSSWLTFVGIENTSAFESFTSRNPSLIFPVAPSISFCSVSSRFVLIWLSNWVGFIYVLKATISVYHETYKKEEMRQRPRTFIESPVHRNRTIDLNTSAARIRSWQLFYGAIDTTSSHSSKSAHSEKDLTLNNNNKESAQHERTPSDGENASNFYYAYPDVAESVIVGDGGCLDELRGQLPWSYIPPQEDGKGGFSGEARIELGDRTKRNYRTKSDSSIFSCTDL